MTEPNPDKSLESLVDRALRDQPLRRAPADLSARVLAAIERREARPWWQKGFQHWPIAARVGFCASSLLAAAFAIEIPMWLMQFLDSNMPLSVNRGIALWQALITAGSSVANSIPMYWIYGGLVVIGTMYATCFGIGAAAYRTLYENR
jgi:predicted outer membrane lipoprotein